MTHKHHGDVCVLSAWFAIPPGKGRIHLAEHSLFYRAILQKRPIVLRNLLIVATSFGDVCVLSAW